MAQIKLKSSDGNCFSIDIKIARTSKTIKEMLNQLGTDGLETEIIPLPNVNSTTLTKIIEWANHHKGSSVLEEQEDDRIKTKKTVLTDWDIDFLTVEKEEGRIFDLILASNYLDITPLLNACCKFVATLIKDKNIDEIREIFQIKPPEGCDKPAPATEASTKASTKATPIETEMNKENIWSENNSNLAANDRPGCSTKSA